MNAAGVPGVKSARHRNRSQVAHRKQAVPTRTGIRARATKNDSRGGVIISRFELRLAPVSVGETTAPYGQRIHNPRDVASLARMVIGNQAQEVVLVFLLDVKNRVVGFSEAARGAIDSCPVDLREVFRVAVMVGASGVVLAHNHPSGDPSPSADDHRLTRRVADAGRLLGITLVDHVIVSIDRQVSLRERGEVPTSHSSQPESARHGGREPQGGITHG